MKRVFDFFFAMIGLILLCPLFLLISIWIVFDSKGGVFFLQSRVGKDSKDFKLFKFRTMVSGAAGKGLLTVGSRDSRITRSGYYLRKYKLDELPQLINVLIGTMSFVGPRPEVRKYTDLYDETQQKVLSVKPGITDYASIEYVDENEILGKAENPEKMYIEEIMPAKLKLNLLYIENPGLLTDLKIIIQTLIRIIR